MSGEVIPLGEFYKRTWERTTPNSWLYATDEHFISNHPPLLHDIGSNVGDIFLCIIILNNAL